MAFEEHIKVSAHHRNTYGVKMRFYQIAQRWCHFSLLTAKRSTHHLCICDGILLLWCVLAVCCLHQGCRSSSSSSSLMHESVSILNDIVSLRFVSRKILKSNVSITANQYNINSWKPRYLVWSEQAIILFLFLCSVALTIVETQRDTKMRWLYGVTFYGGPHKNMKVISRHQYFA